jgi:hypothetical protein
MEQSEPTTPDTGPETAGGPDPAAEEPDQDAEPTMTAPPEDRPDAAGSALHGEGTADSPDAADADGRG